MKIVNFDDFIGKIYQNIPTLFQIQKIFFIYKNQFLDEKWIVFIIMLTCSSERNFNQMRYYWKVKSEDSIFIYPCLILDLYTMSEA